MILSRLPTRFGTRGDNPLDNPLGLGGYPMFNPAIFPQAELGGAGTQIVLKKGDVIVLMRW